MPDDAGPTGEGDAGTPARLRPTIIGPAVEWSSPSGRKRAGASAGGPGNRLPAGKPTPASGRVVTSPTAIPGVARKRIAVTAVDIDRLSPGVAPATAAKAVRLIEGFVVEGARDRQVTMWGHAAQQDYADRVSRTLELAQSEVLARVRGHVGRMIGLLGAIDLASVCGGGRPTGLFDRLFRGAGERIDTPRELDLARVELDQLVQLTGGALEPLLVLKDALDEQSRRIAAAGQDIEAASLAAAFLSGHLATDQPALSRRFLERSMSLAQSALQIRSSGSLRNSQIEEPLRLVAAIQDVVLVTLPGWLGAIAALSAASTATRAPNPTEAGELQHQLRTILQQLKT